MKIEDLIQAGEGPSIEFKENIKSINTKDTWLLWTFVDSPNY